MSLAAWLVHVVTVQEPDSREADAHGDPTWKAARTIRARVERTSSRVMNADGDEVVSAHRLVTTCYVDPRARFWFPSINGEPADDVDDVASARTPITSQSATTRAGTRGHWEFFF